MWTGVQSREDKMKKIIAFLLMIFLFVTQISRAAQISYFNQDGMNGIVIAGPIEIGDYNKFKNIVRNIRDNKAVIFLNSHGGAAYEAINIGEYINKTEFVTAVTANDECYSACAIIWSSAKYRFASLPKAIIGFHAIYNGYTGEQTGFANAKLGAVLGRWGYSDSAIEFMTFAKPQEFNYLTKNNAVRYGITYKDINFSNNHTSYNTQYEQSAYDTVLGFYNALSIADGDLAAAYVIPEKRGIGAFNQTNIFNFYSSLRQPLQVQSITEIDNEKFKVKYTFVATRKQCNGVAIVNVTKRNGHYLIQSIKANC